MLKLSIVQKYPFLPPLSIDLQQLNIDNHFYTVFLLYQKVKIGRIVGFPFIIFS